MQRLKMHSVSIFLLLQGVIVRREDRAVSGADLLKMKVSSLAGTVPFCSLIGTETLLTVIRRFRELHNKQD